MPETRPSIAVLGGTGALGRALAQRWVKAGYEVVIGSRSADKAEATAEEINQGTTVRGMDNVAAAAAADIAVLTVPFAHHRAMLERVKAVVQGKILVDVTVPLAPPRVSIVRLPPEGAVSAAAQAFLGDGVKVVSAFQNIAAKHLQAAHNHVDCDVLVCGNDAAAREAVIALVEAVGMRGWHAGPIDNAVVAEALTSALIFINDHYGIDGAGIRITGKSAG